MGGTCRLRKGSGSRCEEGEEAGQRLVGAGAGGGCRRARDGVRVGSGGRDGARLAVVADAPFLAPVVEFTKDAGQVNALVAELVLDADGALAGDATLDDVLLGQVLEGLAEDLGADVAHGVLEFVEASGLVHEAVNDDEVPFLAEDLGAFLDGAQVDAGLDEQGSSGVHLRLWLRLHTAILSIVTGRLKGILRLSTTFWIVSTNAAQDATARAVFSSPGPDAFSMAPLLE